MPSRCGFLAAAALESYALFQSGKLSVSRTANPTEIVEQLTRAVGGRFHPMDYNFTTLQLQPVAGLVREIDGRKIIVAVYQGQAASLLLYLFRIGRRCSSECRSFHVALCKTALTPPPENE